MKFLSILGFNIFLLYSPSIADNIPTKSEIIKKSNECLRYFEKQKCKKLISQLEGFQLFEFEQNRFKCQTSILGLQTEIVEVQFFRGLPKWRNGIMIPYVIKNC